MFPQNWGWGFCCYVVTGPVKRMTNKTQIRCRSCLCETGTTGCALKIRRFEEGKRLRAYKFFEARKARTTAAASR